MYKITGTQRSYPDNSIKVNSIQLEDTIRPVPLKFAAPLRDRAADPKGFDYHWERLTYLFDLDDPANFPGPFASLQGSERDAAVRFVTTCMNLAGYSVLSADGRMSMHSSGGERSFSSVLPSHEAFAGFSATFRQLHNDMENASFTKVWNSLNKAAGGLNEKEAAEARAVLKSWKKARAQLMQKMSATLVCERLRPKGANPDAPKSFMGVVPDDIIKAYNYGDSLHWGDQRETLTVLAKDSFSTDFYKHVCVSAITSLSHFYFGFAYLVAVALGPARAMSA
ncbi:hypothetical protein [Rhodococcus sp. NPDC004095]